MCVRERCVCEREGEGERERCVCETVCVREGGRGMCVRERERESVCV